MVYLEKISDRIYAHTEGKTIGNVGVIATEFGNYIVDTTMFPKLAKDIRGEIEEIGNGKVLGAILTHYHLDHTAGNQLFHPHIHAHKLVLENMKKNYSQDAILKSIEQREDKDLFGNFELTYPSIIFETNPYSPDDTEQIEVYQTGGHTNGSCLVYYKEEKVLFAGDNLFAGLYPWGGDPTASPYDWVKATELILEKRPDIIVPGHGETQYNLKEVESLGTYLKQIIATGEKLLKDEVEKEKIVESLVEIESNPEKNEGMKERTLNHWYHVIKDQNYQ